MNYRKLCSSVFSSAIFLSTVFLSAVVMTGLAAAQQPAKIKRPVKNPPQFPNIIDLQNKDARQTDRQADQQDNAPVADAGGQPDSLAAAVQSLASELRALGQELRSLNIRGQAQIEMMKMKRAEMRVDYYERGLPPAPERRSARALDEQLWRHRLARSRVCS